MFRFSTLFSKSIFALTALLLCSISANAQRNQVFSARISSSTDDAEEQGLNGNNPGRIDITSSDIELVEDGGDGNQFVGLRFAGVNIPRNAIIDSAFIQFTVDEEVRTGAASVVIRTENNDNSTTFTSSDNDISGRNTNSVSVNWNNIPDWNSVREAGLDQRTPNIASLVKDIISRNGWNSGNAISFIITGTGRRNAVAYDDVPSESPQLTVHYSLPTSTTFSILASNDDAEEDLIGGSIDITSSDLELVTENQEQAIGLRYANVSIPQGATITSAYLQFRVDEVSTSGNVDVAFLVENTDDAQAYSPSTNNISGRPYSNADTILWNINQWPNVGTVGSDQQSPDLSTLIQAIVDKQTWFSGNALALLAIDPQRLGISGYAGNTGRRTAESFDGSGGPQLVVEYLEPNRYINGNFPIAKNSSWKYLDNGIDLSNTWLPNNFDDSNWKFGNAVLGYSNPSATTINFGPDPNNKHITTYLRHTFNGDNAQEFDSLIFKVLRDDGVVVYINGVEAFRSNMPNGNIDYTTLASGTVGGSDETTYYEFRVDNTLTPGENTIAVELHQAEANSSDLSFDLEVEGKLPPLATTAYPINSGDEWSYLDNGVDISASDWKSFAFNDTAWNYGPAPLGYSNPVNTTLSFGPDANDKYITYYFRKRINVSNLASLPDSIILNLKRDDGAIVYINGVELIRSNLPLGPVDYNTFSTEIVSGADEDAFYSTTVSKNVLKQGNNIFAVELHQRDGTSSDLGFDFEIIELPTLRNSCVGENDAHISCYTSLEPSGQGPDFFIPNTHAFQLLLEQGNAYTDQSVRSNVPGNNDFTGYIGKNGSSSDGFVGINHENSPGGVSIIDIHYEASSKIWSVDASAAVDFYNNDLVTTTRNCSGGITPWGTYITSEESTNAGDANSDGYEDVGWQIEIDPVTKAVKTYGNGKQEKLWAMGRMSHENVVVANDSLTAYEGEDSGNGLVYKFVADNKMDLSSGTLYALKLDGGLNGGEPVLPTGEWIIVPNSTKADRNNTRSLALSLGATPFNGVEDVEIGTIDNKIYFTAKGSSRVYRFKEAGNDSISEFETFVGGQSYIINYGSGIVSESWGSGNDNLCFDDLGNLYVLQDGSRNHVWMISPDHTQAKPKVDIFAKLPSGSEPCGMTFTPDYKFMFLSVQHPSGSNSSTFQVDAAGNMVDMSRSATLVIARKEFLGDYAPTTIASNLSVSNIECTKLDINFSRSSSDGHIVIVKEGSPVDVAPLDGINYNDSSKFGLGTEIGIGNFVVYEGTDTSISLTGLKSSRAYHYAIFDYNQDPNKFYNKQSAKNIAGTNSISTSPIIGNETVEVGSTEIYSVNNRNGSSYSWSISNGTIISGAGSNQITITWNNTAGLGSLNVTESNSNGCSGNTKTKSVQIKNSTVGINNVDFDDAISISPNPSTGKSLLNLSSLDGKADITISNIQGKNILVVKDTANNYTIDLSNKEKGTYLVRIESQGKVAIKKLIIQ